MEYVMVQQQLTGVSGFQIMERNEWREYVKGITSLKLWPHSLYIGNSTEAVFENANDYLNHFNVYSVTEEEVAVIDKVFGRRVLGSVELIDLDLAQWDDENLTDSMG